MLYKYIFVTNVLRILDERGMHKLELAERAGVSISFLSDITNLKGNPSLEILEKIAQALETPLPHLLEASDLNAEALNELAQGHWLSSVPTGFERVSVVLPSHQAFIVKKWADDAKAATTKAGPKTK